MRELLSVIVPCYNEGAVIERTAKAIVDTCTGRAFDFEIIFVNDGSKDDTLAFLKKLAGRSEKINTFLLAGTLEKRQQCFPGWNIAREVVQ
jgi:Glycosyltransferases involved in cell wall biogenesis